MTNRRLAGRAIELWSRQAQIVEAWLAQPNVRVLVPETSTGLASADARRKGQASGL